MWKAIRDDEQKTVEAATKFDLLTELGHWSARQGHLGKGHWVISNDSCCAGWDLFSPAAQKRLGV